MRSYLIGIRHMKYMLQLDLHTGLFLRNFPSEGNAGYKVNSFCKKWKERCFEDPFPNITL